MWDSVPWFVGGGAEHTPEVARLLAHVATSGADGVAAVDDLKVAPLAVPGASVRVLSGACVIPSRATGAKQQSYMGRNPTEDVVSIAATGSGSGRNDMVIARVEDPYMAGEPWSNPPDPKTGPYIFSRVLTNVPATAVASRQAARDYLLAQGVSGIPLAGVILPASTGTVTAAMIRDLRSLALPRSQQEIYTLQTGPAWSAINSSTWTVWPTQFQPWVDVPAWATTANVQAIVTGAAQYDGRFKGYLSLRLGSVNDNVAAMDLLIDVAADRLVNNYARDTLATGGKIPNLRKFAGTRQQWFMLGARTEGVGRILTAADCQVNLIATFREEII